MRARDLLLCCAIAAAPLSYAAPGHAADSEAEARERFDRAVKLYEEGNYDAALVEFQRAAALRPSYKLFYNMGQVRVALNDPAAALGAYRQYLEQGGDKIPAARRTQVQEEMKRLEQRVARLTVETDVAGAEVSIDDVSVGSTPLDAPVLVNSGSRRVQVRHPDYLPQRRVLSLAGGVEERAVFRLAAGTATPRPAASHTPNADGPAQTSPAPPRKARKESNNSGIWIGWAATGALAAGAAVTGVMALSKDSDLEEQLQEPVERKQDLDSDAKTVRTLAILSDGLAVAALAVGGVTLWLTLSSDDDEADWSVRTAAKPRRPSVGISMGPTGASVRGSF